MNSGTGENKLDHTKNENTCLVSDFLIIMLTNPQTTAPHNTKARPINVTEPSLINMMLVSPNSATIIPIY